MLILDSVISISVCHHGVGGVWPRLASAQLSTLALPDGPTDLKGPSTGALSKSSEWVWRAESSKAVYTQLEGKVVSKICHGKLKYLTCVVIIVPKEMSALELTRIF